uniref:Uncharacterized protein n=2 Tax=Acrobeloides nanus TaxID=290746 RepID=A0A914BXV3_9BILA
MTVLSNEVNEVIYAVRAIHDISTPNSQRFHYTQGLELLKESDPSRTIPLAFQLVTNEDRLVQHLGWNIIEHTIRYKWGELNPEMRIAIRNGCWQHLSHEQPLIHVADANVRTALARSIVYMIEQEWPQNWPELITQFEAIVKDQRLVAPCQTVFYVLRRLIEDIVTLSNLEDIARRKDLNNALVSSMTQIFDMTISRVRQCIIDNSESSYLLAKTAIELLSESVEWVVGKILEDFIDPIVEILCAYLRVTQFGIYEHAAKCLYKIAARKRATKTETPIVVSMFQDAPMQAILSASSLAAEVSSASADHYRYLKTLCDLLSALGVHLSDVWGHIKHPPPNFANYLTAISALFKHPSIYIRTEMAQALITFVVHDEISKTDEFIRCIVEILPHVPQIMERVGSINETSSLTSHYSRMDYEDEYGYMHDFTQLRDRCIRLIRESTRTHFTLLFNVIADWMNKRCLAETKEVRISEWESMKRFISNILQEAYNLHLVTPEVEQKFVLFFDSVVSRLQTLDDARVINEMLSIASALFSIFDNHPTRIPMMLFQLKSFLLLENLNNENKELLEMKRHCISLILRMVSSYSKLIVPYAQDVLNVVIEAADRVSIMQRAQLVQVLGALSNLATSPEEQRVFLQSAIQEHIQFLQSDTFLNAVSSSANFLAYIGLTVPAPQNDLEAKETFKAHLQTIEGVMSQVKADEDKPNPLFSLILPVIPQIFRLVRSLFGFHRPEILSLIDSTYGKSVVDITQSDKVSIATALSDIEIPSSQSTSTMDSVDHLRRFISDLHEITHSIIGLLGSKYASEFYAQVISSELASGTLESIEYLPDFRLRIWIRKAWKPLICSCPAKHAAMIVPFLTMFTTHLHGLLKKRWEAVESVDYDAEPTEEELFMENMTTVLSREVTTFFKSLVLGDATVIRDDKKYLNQDILTPLFQSIYKEKQIFENIVATLCLLVICRDTQTAIKAVPIAKTIVNQCCEIFNEQIALNILIYVIRGLQVHGTDEFAQGSMLTLIYNVYSSFRRRFPNVLDILKQVPEANEQTVDAFDKRITELSLRPEKTPEKVKRDAVRKFFRPLIPMNIGDQHKRPIRLRTLPPLQKNEKMAVEEEDQLYLLENLFS